MKLNDPKFWISVGGMILAAGIYIGKLEQRITVLEKQQQFSHGDLTPWLEHKE